jgi:hypothetical protein
MSNALFDYTGQNNKMLNSYIDKKFKKLYPDLNPDTIDEELLNNIIYNIVEQDNDKIIKIKKEMSDSIDKIYNNSNLSKPTKSIEPTQIQILPFEESKDSILYDNLDIAKLSEFAKPNNLPNKINNKDNDYNEIIEQNILMADKIIPEMSFGQNLIYLNGYLNGHKINLMVDTGASGCVILKSTVEKCGLGYLVDSKSSVMIEGAHGLKSTLGTIWYLEIDLEIDKDKIVSIPITLEVIDDTDTIKTKKIIQESNEKIAKMFDNFLSPKSSSNLNSNSHDSFEIILGMTFLKSYKADIDFSSMTITLNKNIKLKFK